MTMDRSPAKAGAQDLFVRWTPAFGPHHSITLMGMPFAGEQVAA